MNFNEEIGKRIKSQREKLGFKQNEIANALQISPQAVSHWEKGINAPDISLLVPLAKLLNVSTDWLLGYYDIEKDAIEASVFVSQIMGLTKKIQTMEAPESALWINGFLHQITESIIKYDGIPVKYLGGGALAFFTGPDHQKRSISASITAKKIVNEQLAIGLHSGNIYVGSIGHKDYASKDISGKTVNTAFRIVSLASETGINSSLKLVSEAGFTDYINKRTEILKGINEPIEICEVKTNSGE
ncbi:MAG: helix-turn-helix domain-containing protein [Spirochaetales bacterium]|nr:helix-turn-helix domain-containing protein [Spirochaetales bacterium]